LLELQSLELQLLELQLLELQLLELCSPNLKTKRHLFFHCEIPVLQPRWVEEIAQPIQIKLESSLLKKFFI
jgi:hypothetical protein